MKTDTIAAIATALSESGIGIIRGSGEEAISIVNKIFVAKKKDFSLENADTHTIHYGHIYDKDKMIDEVLVSVMKNPRSYTGEDVVEINCHGGILLMQKMLELVIKEGRKPKRQREALLYT